MKFQFENLGVIDQAEVELADLTLICGENNTGKTYIIYAIYQMLVEWRQLIGWRITEAEMQQLHSSGVVSIDMQKRFVDVWPEIHKNTCETWRSSLHYALSAPVERFRYTKLKFEPGWNNVWKSQNYSSELRSQNGKILYSIKKPSDSTILNVAVLQDGNAVPDLPEYNAWREFVRDDLLEAVLSHRLQPVFMVSAERTGVVQFNEQINLTQSRLLHVLSALGPEVRSAHRQALLDALSRRIHATPIENNLKFIGRIASLEGRSGVLMEKHPEILEACNALAGGRFEIKSPGIVQFIPSGSAVRLELSEASSSVRSLFILWSWIKAEAAPGHWLLIDEPEMNLHPKSQRLFSRLIARLINAGIKILITTHSDYLIKELNTLIMLNQRTEHTRAVQQQHGYAEAELLDPARVRLYMTALATKPASGAGRRARTLKAATIEPDRGIEVETFDDTIEIMNTIQSELLYGGEL